MSPVTRDGASGSRKRANTFNDEGSIDSDFRTYLTDLCETGDHSSTDTEPSQDHTSFSNLDVPDPDYLEFLKHLKQYGNAYALEIPNGNAGSELVVYEALSQEIVEHRPTTKRRLRDSLNITNKSISENKKGKTLEVLNDNLGLELVEQEDEPDPKCKKNLKNSEQICEVNLTSGTNLVTRSLRSNFQTKEPKGSNMPEIGENSMGENITDSCYQEFLNSLHMEGDSMVLVTADGKRIRYGECDDVDKDENNDESSSDIEILENYPVPEIDHVTPQISESHTEGGDDDLQWVPKPCKHSEYREKLMQELKRPYDQDEYEKLLDDVKEQIPVSKHPELRARSRGSQNVETSLRRQRKRGHSKYDKPGKSYLQLVPDLEEQLTTVFFDRPKVLNILRGFFYWLQNLSNEGAFRPWKDRSCLKVMPEIL